MNRWLAVVLMLWPSLAIADTLQVSREEEPLIVLRHLMLCNQSRDQSETLLATVIVKLEAAQKELAELKALKKGADAPSVAVPAAPVAP